MRFKSGKTVSTLFIKKSKLHNIIFLVYGDNIIQDLVTYLSSFFPLKDIGPLYYLYMDSLYMSSLRLYICLFSTVDLETHVMGTPSHEFCSDM
jgi:hypothetical protein